MMTTRAEQVLLGHYATLLSLTKQMHVCTSSNDWVGFTQREADSVHIMAAIEAATPGVSFSEVEHSALVTRITAILDLQKDIQQSASVWRTEQTARAQAESTAKKVSSAYLST